MSIPVVAVAGEALVDLITDGDALRPVAGGGPFNTAVALGRLGVPVRYVGGISRDPFGVALEERLAESGVDRRYVVRTGAATPLAIVHASGDGGHEFSFYLEGTAYADVAAADLPALDDDVKVLHVGTLALATDPPAAAYEALIARECTRRLVVLDPNIRPLVCRDRASYVRRFEAWANQVHIVKLSDDDMRWLYPGVDHDAVVSSLLERRVEVVILTLGARGARVRTAAAEAGIAAFDVTPVDTVGAGDAFGAGFVRKLWESGSLDPDRLRDLGGRELGEALTFAAAVAALQCTRSGAEPPMLAEVQQFLDAEGRAAGSGLPTADLGWP